VYRQGAAFAVDVLPLGLVVVDLPMALGHEVLADENRFTIEYPDAPVLFRVEKLLSQQQHRVLEQFGGSLEQCLLALDLDHTPGKTTSPSLLMPVS
jgi:hypothetical protein